MHTDFSLVLSRKYFALSIVSRDFDDDFSPVVNAYFEVVL